MKNRIIFGVLGASITIALVMASRWSLYAAVLVLVCLAIREVFGMVGKRSPLSFIAFSLILITCFSSLIGLRHIDYTTIAYVIFACLAAFITDTAALAFGLKFGKHKLTKISPKKTWEGAIGGVLTAVAVCTAYMLIVDRFTPWIPLIALIASISAIFGDLAASLVKRKFGAKDYGAMIPGHGGIMDRCDSLMFAAPVSYILLNFLV